MGKVANRVAPETGAVHLLGTFRRQPSLVVGQLTNGESPRETCVAYRSLPAKQLSSSFSSSSMIFSTGWIPAFLLDSHPVLEAYDRLVVQDLVPDPVSDALWTRDRIFRPTEDLPLVADALWESVLALWRLRKVRPEGDDVDLWRQYVVAWLVRWIFWFCYVSIADYREDSPPGVVCSSTV